MIVFAWVCFVFIGLRFFISFFNLIVSDSLENRTASKSKTEAKVSILIPARNEETNLPNLLRSIRLQSYTNFEVIVCDDSSEDKTYSIIQEFSSIDSRFSGFKNDSLPEGWRGKNYACYLLSKKSRGDYLLFLDADVVLTGDIINSTVTFLRNKRHALLSIFPKQDLKSTGEYFIVPLMNQILLSLLPLSFVQWFSSPSLSASNGQYMLFDSIKYHRYTPHFHVKNHVVEDILIARYLKSEGESISVHANQKQVRCRMYYSWNEALDGFSKNIVMFFGNHFVFAFMYWFLGTFSLIVIAFALSFNLFLLSLTLYFFNQIFVSLCSHQPVIKNCLSIPLQQYSLLLLLWKNRMYRKQKNQTWKGRNIS